MKRYTVRITGRAQEDMAAIYAYIAETLQSPGSARKLYERLADEIMGLDVFPERNRLFDSAPERELGMRRLLVNSYSVIYTVGEDVVTVLRVLYSASDLIARLREDSE